MNKTNQKCYILMSLKTFIAEGDGEMLKSRDFSGVRNHVKILLADLITL
jgi:hypothetical protein